MLEIIETSILFVGVIAFAWLAPARKYRLVPVLELLLGAIGSSQRLAVILSGALSLLASAAIWWFGYPYAPHLHDEFSHLLQADTFAHGRLTNPTHPFWQHFESFHIIQQPTYASKFPPGQGLMLALGQVLFGRPIVGAWLSSALASAALCWMLFAFVSPRWAALGGLLAAVHPLLLSWSRTYWGGALAACGGALVLGAAGRLRSAPRIRDGLLLGIGLALLANTRPFEGLVFSIAVLCALLAARFRQDRTGFLLFLGRCTLSAGVVLAPAGAAMGYYNWRVTGNALRLPYQVHQETYTIASPFLWQAPRPEPHYRHPALRDLHVLWELRSYEEERSLAGFGKACVPKLARLVHWYLPLPMYLIPLAVVPFLLKDRTLRTVLILLLVFVAGLLSETWLLPHYASPAMGLFLILTVQAWRRIRLWRWQGKEVGRLLLAVTVIVTFLMCIDYCRQMVNDRNEGWQQERARLLAQLQASPGRHLVIVRYLPDHSPHREWVYNEADIDNAKVVWARDMGKERNAELERYFSDRKEWMIEVP
jgi:hypothetical protein